MPPLASLHWSSSCSQLRCSASGTYGWLRRMDSRMSRSCCSCSPATEGCEANIFVPRDAAGVEFYVGTYGRPGPPLTVLLRDSSGTVLRRGSLRSGYEDAGWQLVRFGRVQREGSDYAVCLRAGGRLAVAGKADPLSDPRSELLLDGTPQQADIAYRMVRDGRESLLSLVPEVIRRAERFRPDWFGPWTFYVAGLLLLSRRRTCSRVHRCRSFRTHPDRWSDRSHCARCGAERPRLVGCDAFVPASGRGLPLRLRGVARGASPASLHRSGSSWRFIQCRGKPCARACRGQRRSTRRSSAALERVRL